MGKSGAARVKAHDAAYGAAMQEHEERNDRAGMRRSIRDARPYVYSPYAGPNAPDPSVETAKERSTDMGVRIDQIRSLIEEKPKDRKFTIMDACVAHVEGARKNAGAKKEFLHGFMQFPTDFKVTDHNQRMMLAIAVDFVNQTYGGNAVFHARIDRDEQGQHGVDVFFAPRYQKHTASKGAEQWISLSKFSKENARARYGERRKEVKNKKTNKFEPVLDREGKPVMVWNDAAEFQGRALQDAWFEHLKAHAGDKYEVERGKQKKGRDPDRLSPEDYAAEQEQKKLLAEVERQLETKEPEVDPEDCHQRVAAKIIEKASERALSEARDFARDAAEKDSETFLARAMEKAKADAAAMTESYLSSEAQEFTAMKRENERLSADAMRQGGIVRLLLEVLKTVLPRQLMATVRNVFDRKWAAASPAGEPFDWGEKPKPKSIKDHSSAPGL